MRPLIVLLFLCPAPLQAAGCASLVTSVCETSIETPTATRKVIKVKPTVTPFVVGDRFPVESHSLLMDPTRYRLAPSDGTWRYYAVQGVVYRVENASARVLEVIRDSRTSHLR
ncbi:MAG: hypothetical protein EON48_02060 [Acetobacteraceae bacterium]|nr:MAG: hypothetical protein EON48_02060 [Acetobacteraceae bacterium]